MNENFIERIELCENENRHLRKRLFHQNLLWLIVAGAVAGGWAFAAYSKAPATFDHIRTKELVVVDASGTIRARLGGNLPNSTVVDGKVVPRGSKAAGLLIYDKDGTERGGYVTQDRGNHAMLTLDSKHGQTALFVAGPGGATALKLWNDENSISLRSGDSGASITIVSDGHVQFQKPTITNLGQSACSAYTNFAKQSAMKALSICETRFTESACRACLGDLVD